MDPVVTLTDEKTGAEIARGEEPVNAALAGTGILVKQRPLSGVPDELMALLKKPVVSPEENTRIKAHFLMSRQECLSLIKAAGREPHVTEGGSMEALCETIGVQYPQLWVIEDGEDGLRFFDYHVNRGRDGTGSDEVGQLLWGQLMRYRYPVLGGVILTMSASETVGWYFTFDGMLPHGGILNETAVGSKILIQVLGPTSFQSVKQ